MAYSSNIGLPKILIDFQSAAATAMIRSSRGVVTMILNDENLTDEDGVVYYNVKEIGDIPALSAKNQDLVKKGLLGTPAQIHIFAIPLKEYPREVESEVVVSTTTVTGKVFVEDPDIEDPTAPGVVEVDGKYGEYVDSEIETTTTVLSTVTVTAAATVTLADALKKAGNLPFNWICHPTGKAADQQDLATWVKNKRKDEHKSYKAVVANVAADDYGVVNFTTEKIRVVNDDYTDALAEVGGDSSRVAGSIAQYLTYSAAEYTARIAGLLAGISLDRSSTYFALTEIVDCAQYENIEDHIDAGEFCLFDEHDSEGVKVARGINSLVTFTATKGESFRFVKIIEAIDMIQDDIATTFKRDYVGKVINSYENKCLLISAINVYLNSLKGNVLDNSDTAENYVELDLQAHKDWASVRNVDVSDYSEQQLKELNTGVNVFLSGKITPVNALEDLTITFVLA